MLNRIYYFAIILFFSFSYNNNVTDQGMEYSLFFDKSEIKGDDIIITLTVDFNIDEGYYIQSSNSSLVMAQGAEANFKWDVTSKFKNLEEMGETPNPKIVSDPISGQKIGKHFNKVQFIQKIIPENDLSPGKYDLKGEFNYQICNNTGCRPKHDPVDHEITIHEYNNHSTSIWAEVSSMIGSFFIAFVAGLIF